MLYYIHSIKYICYIYIYIIILYYIILYYIILYYMILYFYNIHYILYVILYISYIIYHILYIMKAFYRVLAKKFQPTGNGKHLLQIVNRRQRNEPQTTKSGAAMCAPHGASGYIIYIILGKLRASQRAVAAAAAAIVVFDS